MAGLAGDGVNGDQALGNLGDLVLEQAQHQVRVRTGNHDRGALGAAACLHQVGAQAGAVRVLLAGNLLVTGQNGLDGAQVDLDHAGVVALLNHAGHQGALAVLELAQHGGVLGVAQTLGQHLAHGGGGDTAKVVRGVVELVDLLVVLIELRGENHELAGGAVDDGTRTLDGAGLLQVREQQGVLNQGEELLHDERALLRQCAQCAQVNSLNILHAFQPFPVSTAPGRSPRPGSRTVYTRHGTARA